MRTIDDDIAAIFLACEAQSSLTLDEVDEELDEDDVQSHDSGGSEKKDDGHGDGDKKASRDEDDGGGVEADCDDGEGGGEEKDGGGVEADCDDGGEGGEEKDGGDEEEGAESDSGSKKPPSPCAIEFPDTSISLTHVKGDK